jgi:protein TonB
MSFAYAENNWNTTRVIGLGAAVAVNAALITILANGLSLRIFEVKTDDLIAVSVPEQPTEPVAEQPIPGPAQPGGLRVDDAVIDPIDIEFPKDTVKPTGGPVTEATGGGTGTGPVIPVIRELKPDPRYLTKPFYPPNEIRQNHEGIVTLLILVGPDGRAQDVKVEKSSGYPRLDHSAVREALSKWRFFPQTENGVPVAALGRYKVRFNLD